MSKPASMAPAAKAAPKAITPAAQHRSNMATAAPTSDHLVGDCPLQHDGVLYLPGHKVELTAEQAARLGAKVVALPVAIDRQPTTLE